MNFCIPSTAELAETLFYSQNSTWANLYTFHIDLMVVQNHSGLGNVNHSNASLCWNYGKLEEKL